MVATTYWTNAKKQQMPIHYVSDTEVKNGGLNKATVEDVLQRANRIYAKQDLPTDKFVLLSRNDDKTVEADVINAKKQEVVQCYVSRSKTEWNALDDVMQLIGNDLPRLRALA